MKLDPDSTMWTYPTNIENINDFFPSTYCLKKENNRDKDTIKGIEKLIRTHFTSSWNEYFLTTFYV